MAERLDIYAGRVRDGDRAAAAKTAEAIRVAAVATEEANRLRSRVEEVDSSFLTEADHVARLQVEIRRHVQAATVQAKRASSLQVLLTTVELERSQLTADAEQHARDLDAAAVKAQGAMDEVVRIRSECKKTDATNRVQQDAALSAAHVEHGRSVEVLRADIARICTERDKTIDAMHDAATSARVEQDAAVHTARAEHGKAAEALRTGIATANCEQQRLSAEFRLLNHSLALSQQLFRDGEARVDRLTTLLQDAQAKAGWLALACADDADVIRTLTRDGAAATTDCVERARGQDVLSASLEEARTERASCQGRERQLDTQLAATPTTNRRTNPSGWRC